MIQSPVESNSGQFTDCQGSASTTTALRKAGGGTTLVISPLLALMRDQLATAGRTGLNRWVFVDKDRLTTSHVKLILDGSCRFTWCHELPHACFCAANMLICELRGRIQWFKALHHQPLRRSPRFQLVRSSGLCNGNKCEISRPEMRMIIPPTALDCTRFYRQALASVLVRDRLLWSPNGRHRPVRPTGRGLQGGRWH
jgi:hypothetical protein